MAIARPMPRAAPVTSATLPANAPDMMGMRSEARWGNGDGRGGTPPRALPDNRPFYPVRSLGCLRPAHSGIRPWDGTAGNLDCLRAARSGVRPWDGPAGNQDCLRAARSGVRPWDGPAGSRPCLARPPGADQPLRLQRPVLLDAVPDVGG